MQSRPAQGAARKRTSSCGQALAPDRRAPCRTRLPDGRAIAWAEYGDPAGVPVVYCHGFPACRLEARLADEAAARRSVRLIAPDRPGFGASDPQWGRRIDDWPRDLAGLLDALEIERCGVVGMSGGGPYALACGALLGERVEAIALMGALGPLADPEATRGMSALAQLSFRLAREHPRRQAAMFHLLRVVVRHTPGAMLRMTLGAGSAADRSVIEQAGIREHLLATMRGSVCQGARPAIEELRRFVEPWPFALADVAAPVRLWHGTDDTVVPPRHARIMAAGLRDATSCIVQGEGHLSLPARRTDAILRKLIGSMAAIEETAQPRHQLG